MQRKKIHVNILIVDKSLKLASRNSTNPSNNIAPTWQSVKKKSLFSNPQTKWTVRDLYECNLLFSYLQYDPDRFYLKTYHEKSK